MNIPNQGAATPIYAVRPQPKYRAGLRPLATVIAALALLTCAPAAARAQFILGNAGDYGLLFEGAGGNTLQITNVTVNGNVGVGMTGKATDSGPSTINGSLNFSAANNGQFSNNNSSDIITGGVSYNVSAVTSALNTVNTLNSTLGALSGNNININLSGSQTLTVNASSGMQHGNDYVFNVTGFNTTNGNTITINNDTGNANAGVVFNFTASANFNNQVALSGFSADQVVWNFVGGSNLTGGPTLAINDNASSSASYKVQGIFLDPNGPISVTNANVFGRVFGGDTHDFQYVSGSTLTAPATQVVPAPSAFGLALAGTVSLGLLGLLRRRGGARATQPG